MPIVYKYFDTPLGKMMGAATDDGVCLFEFEYRRSLSKIQQRIKDALQMEYEEGDHPLLDQLETMSATVPAVKWAFVLINRGELDFGSAATRSMIDQLIPGPAGVALKATAEVADPISEFDVRRACWSDAGEWIA